MKIATSIHPSEKSATARRRMILALYTVIVITPPVLATALGQMGHADDRMARVGANLALSGFAMVCLQFVLSARISWIERAFGLDALLAFHRKTGMWAGIFLLAHPLLMAAGEAGASLLYATGVERFIWIGRAALLVLIIQILVSVWKSRIRLSYEKWRMLHAVAAWTVLGLGFLHSWTGGSSLESWAMRVFWIALVAAALGTNVWHKFIRPLRLRTRPFRVKSIFRETEDVHTIVLEPLDGGRVRDFLPGQFHFLTPIQTDSEIPSEEHPFTISSCPTEHRSIASSIKQSGDFTTRHIPKISEGDLFSVLGPFGRFSYRLHPEEKRLLFIAGGIGITPLMSMLRHLGSTGRDDIPVTLLYANKCEEDIAFREELIQLSSGGTPNLEIIHVLSDPPPAWQGETGHIGKRLIASHLDDPEVDSEDITGVYLCGPPAMMESIKKILTELGISNNRVHAEAFEF
ncbi:MAG: ferric reductase-like transmembrane domain-containing protein [Luteolibacter sp.]